MRRALTIVFVVVLVVLPSVLWFRWQHGKQAPANDDRRPHQVVDAGAGAMDTALSTAGPSDRVIMPLPMRKLPRVPGRLNLDTIPVGADVWVDGVLRGQTPVDLTLGTGGHRVVVLKDGFWMKRAVYDTTEGEWVRLSLQPLSPPATGQAYVNVRCRGQNHYPVLVDDEETGRLCPTTMLAVTPGVRRIGVFVPLRRATVAVEVDVAPGIKPMPVTLTE